MGNDMDVCSKDVYLEEYYKEQYGPEHESTWQFFLRSYTRLCDSLVHPKRFLYETSDLSPTKSIKNVEWNITEFKIFSRLITIHCCQWKPIIAQEKVEVGDNKRPLCILYFHTNLRSVCDAKEILPIAAQLNATVLSMDLPGCGKSEGNLNGNMDEDMEHFLEWVNCLVGEDAQVILWGRGVSTAPVLTLAARLSTRSEIKKPTTSSTKSQTGWLRRSSKVTEPVNEVNQASAVKLPEIVGIILDSPFKSVEDVVKSILEKAHGKGFTIAKTFIKMIIKRTVARLANSLDGLNLFSVKPIENCPQINYPVFILSAIDDDYIPDSHGQAMSRVWGHSTAHFINFDGKHFGERSAGLLGNILPFIHTCCGYKNTTAQETNISPKMKTQSDLKFTPIIGLTSNIEVSRATAAAADMDEGDVDDVFNLVELDNSEAENEQILDTCDADELVKIDLDNENTAVSNNQAVAMLAPKRSISNLAVMGMK